MKVYQPKGCEDQHSAKEADSAGILTLLKDCDHFHPYISSLADIDDVSVNNADPVLAGLF